MRKLSYALLIYFIIALISCKNESNPVTNNVITPPPTPVGWSMVYQEQTWGTFTCTMQNGCWYDIVTDSLDFRNCDSVRVLLYYHSYKNATLTLNKVPYPLELFNYSFPDSTIGKIDTSIFISFDSKALLDFSFYVSNKFTIDTLKVYRRVKS